MNRIAALSMLSMLVACASIREVRRSPTGGEVAIPSQDHELRDEAQALMKTRCPAGYDIVEESEAVVGQSVSASTYGSRNYSSTTATARDNREWRIKYQCKGTPQPAGPAGAPAPAGTGSPNGANSEVFQIVIHR